MSTKNCLADDAESLGLDRTAPQMDLVLFQNPDLVKALQLPLNRETIDLFLQSSDLHACKMQGHAERKSGPILHAWQHTRQ